MGMGLRHRGAAPKSESAFGPPGQRTIDRRSGGGSRAQTRPREPARAEERRAAQSAPARGRGAPVDGVRDAHIDVAAARRRHWSRTGEGAGGVWEAGLKRSAG